MRLRRLWFLSAPSRRQFLCSTAAGTLAASTIAQSLTGATPAQAQQAPAAGRPILLRGGCVLSLDRAIGDFEQADVLVEGSRISAIRPNIDAPNAEVIDASNTIVMPGFVDTHRHMWQGFLRNVLPDGSLQDYIQTRAAQVRRDDDGRRCLRRRSAERARRHRRRRDLRARLVAHPQHSGAHGRRHQRACRSPACARVFAYGSSAERRPGVSGRTTPGNKFPGDIARLRKQYFYSEDQLMTLLPGGARRRARDHAAYRGMRLATPARAISYPRRQRRRVRPQRVAREAQCCQNALKSDTTYIHCCTLNDTEWKLIQRYRRHGLDRRLRRDADGSRQSADPESRSTTGIRPVAERRRRDLGAERLLHTDAHRSLSLQKNEVWARQASPATRTRRRS